MVVPISLIAQFIGMFVASKVLQLNVNIIGIVLLTFIPIGITNIVPGLAGVGLALLSLIILVKIYDGSASFLKIVGILFISITTQAALYKFAIEPSLEHAINNADKVTIENGRLTVE